MQFRNILNKLSCRQNLSLSQDVSEREPEVKCVLILAVGRIVVKVFISYVIIKGLELYSLVMLNRNITQVSLTSILNLLRYVAQYF